MLTKEELEVLIAKVKEKLGETESALMAEDLLGIVSAYSSALDEIDKLNEEMSKLTSDNEELLKVNGKLFQKVGFEDEKEDEEKITEDDVEEIKVEDIIDEKGDFIDE